MDGKETVVVLTSCMVAFLGQNWILDNQIQTQERHFFNYLAHNFRLYLQFRYGRRHGHGASTLLGFMKRWLRR